MEAVILIGLQATGKSSFYAERYSNTHLRLNMDMLKTRHREATLLDAFIQAKASFVSDNTNPTRADRQRYIRCAREAGYRVVGFYFRSSLADSMERNSKREGKSRVPDIGLQGTFAKLQLPKKDEGFDELHYVTFDKSSGFAVEQWNDEI
ncbi:MAG: AAA family ATPase [Planctomycetes bacterium]|nr:AAA family ATPase [Planctomycetota bacterium]